MLLSLFFACSGSSETPQPAPSRVDAVAVAPQKAVDLDGFCEARPDATDAPTFAWPEMDAPAPADASTWRWINLWATWCGPCIEEMPRLNQWPGRLSSEGVSIDLQFVSLDARSEDVTQFKSKYSWAPVSHRVSGDGMAWVRQVNLGVGEVLPLHVFVDPENRIRCARTGALSSEDYASVKALVRGG